MIETKKKGKRRPYSVLAVERQYDVSFEELMRERLAAGMSLRQIAREFGCSHQTVIRNRRLLQI